MMKKLLKQKILLGLLVTLTANLAIADDSSCKFYPKQGGLIEEYLKPTPVEDANGRELIEKLAPNDIVAVRLQPLIQDGIVFAREGSDTWTIRRAVESNKKPALYASVHGPSSVAQKWLQDYHRALTTTLAESLRRGVKIDITTQGSCK
ncbi:hypothetical protein Jab_2c26650 [Janthinobacterium sp. HH01]|uniref:hypothetical protein n=1 Tax=Janthinobacterium sp. HH01 TaxID=1198452 RepID=UPI0002AEB6CD|nr:hypothetical protein [Janthinobacterium sp. HH01]ELX10570.1 hypothetical protein Jab_2c26650 [Janthinobacterium sp. HH01]